jgi:hypothetical protein
MTSAVMHEEMHQRTGQDKQIWPVSQEMSAMFRPEKERGDQQEPDKGNLRRERPPLTAGGIG